MKHTHRLRFEVPFIRERPHYFLEGVMITALLALAEVSGAAVWFRRAGELVVKPATLVSTRIAQVVSAPGAVLVRAYGAGRRVQDLESRLAETTVQLGELEALKAENISLRQIIAVATVSGSRSPLFPLFLSGSSLYLRITPDQGVKVGSLIMMKGTVIGEVRRTTDTIAEIILLSDVQHPVLVAKTQSGAEGIIQGDGRQIRLTEVPLDRELRVGEIVTTAGQPGVPPHLLLGRIIVVEQSDTQSVKAAVLDQGLDIYQEQFVEVR